jgi:ferredoxin-NADP reductase
MVTLTLRRLSSLPHLAATAASPRASALFLPARVELARALSPTVRLLRLRLVSGAEAAAAAAAEMAAAAAGSLARPLPPDLDLGAAGGAPLRYSAGQWVDLAVPGEAVVGGFSLVSAPRAPPEVVAAAGSAPPDAFDLAVKIARSPPAAWAHSAAAAPGAVVGVRVGGAFTLDRALRRGGAPGAPFRARRALFVAGGVGVNPLYSMVLELAAAHARGESGAPRAALLLSARSRAELIFRAELEALARGPLARGALELRFFVTRNEEEEKPAAGAAAAVPAAAERISAETIARAVRECGGPDGLVVLICGPPKMADAVAVAARDAGVANEDVVYERWW